MYGYVTSLKERDLEAITELEKELGSQLPAFACQDIKPAQLKRGQLGKVRDLEKDLNLYLVAVNA